MAAAGPIAPDAGKAEAAEDFKISEAGRAQSLIAVITAASMVGMLLGLTLPLLALIMERRGAPAGFIGANSAMPALTMLLFAPFIPALLRRLHAAWLMLGCMALGAVTLLAFNVIDNLWLWFPLRVVNGIALVALFVISETWIQALARPTTRGRLLAIYVTCFSVGWALGPVIMQITGTQGWPPFLAGAGLLVLSMGVLALALPVTPKLASDSPARPAFAMVLERPAAFGAVLTFSAIEAGVFTFLPIYGVRVGFSEAQGALMLAAVGFGSAALQVPIGMLSDRLGRSPVFVLCALVGVAGAVLLPVLSGEPWLLYTCTFVWGGATAGLYTVSMAALGDSYRGNDLIVATSTFTVIYGLGALLAPPASGLMMDHVWDPHGLALFLGLICAVYALLAGVRYWQRAGTPAD